MGQADDLVLLDIHNISIAKQSRALIERLVTAPDFGILFFHFFLVHYVIFSSLLDESQILDVICNCLVEEHGASMKARH